MVLCCCQAIKRFTRQRIDKLDGWIADQKAPSRTKRDNYLDRQRDYACTWDFNLSELLHGLLNCQRRSSCPKRRRSIGCNRNILLVIEPTGNRVTAEANYTAAIILNLNNQGVIYFI